MQFPLSFLLRIMYVLFIFRLYYFIYPVFPRHFFQASVCNKVPEAGFDRIPRSGYTRGTEPR